MSTIKEIIAAAQDNLEKNHIRVEKIDDNRPWGGFLVIDERDTIPFASLYFPELDISPTHQKLSPKILIVQPHKKLSWQYHHRRKEVWKLIQGSAALIRSINDIENPEERMSIGNLISLEQGERHRLVGLDDWGVVAEIWMHTDPSNPSDEDDIVRLQDDFGRK